MDPFLRRRTNTGVPENLQVMSPTAPSGEIQGPNANDGDGVEGHQDLVPAMSAGPMGCLATRKGWYWSELRAQSSISSLKPRSSSDSGSWTRFSSHRDRRASCPTSTSTLCNSFESNVWSNGSGHQAFASWCYDHHGCTTSPSRFATRVSMAWGDSSQDNGECEAR